jgi:hypothetical protein
MRASGRDAATPRRDRMARVHRLAGAANAALVCALAAGWLAPASGAAPALCLVVAAAPSGEALDVIALDPGATRLTLDYVHSVTRTPVVETYRASAEGITQTSISFTEHGPGLPTEGVDGERWERRDGRFVVTMNRVFTTIRMRVHADQRPLLAVAGRSVALAQWGNRALDLHAGRCPALPQ